MHLIENEFLRIKAREYGAELTSVVNKKSGLEHLWQADPQWWGWHAPVLFPVVGRCLNDEILVNGKNYPMQKHGFARKRNFRLLELGDNRMVFSLQHSEETLNVYPYKFEFLIGYQLQENSVVVRYEVVNEDDKPIWFQLGGHPAFRMPLTDDESISDVVIRFGKEETLTRHHISADGFFTGRTSEVARTGREVALTPELFSDDALIFKNHQSREVTLLSGGSGHSTSVRFEDFPYLGIWAKPGAPYVCIEPWFGCADKEGAPLSFEKKEGVLHLDPGQEFTCSYTITVQ